MGNLAVDRGASLASIVVAALLTLPAGVAAVAIGSAAPDEAPSPWDGPWRPRVGEAEVRRFVEAWSARVQDRAWFQDYAADAFIPEAIRREGFHALDPHTRMYLVHRLFEHFQASIPEFRSELAALGPAEARGRLQDMQTAMFRILFEKPAWLAALRSAGREVVLPERPVGADDALALAVEALRVAEALEPSPTVVPPSLRLPEPARVLALERGRAALGDDAPLAAAAPPAPSAPVLAPPPEDLGPQPRALGSVSATTPSADDVPIDAVWPARRTGPLPGAPGSPIGSGPVPESAPPAVGPDPRDVVGEPASAAPVLPPLPELVVPPDLLGALRDLLDLVPALDPADLVPPVTRDDLPTVPALPNPEDPDPFLDELFERIQPGTLDAVTYLACVVSEQVRSCDRVPSGAPAAKDVDGDGYPDVLLQYIPLLVPNPDYLSGFTAQLLVSQPAPASLQPPQPPKPPQVPAPGGLKAHAFIVAAVPDTSMRFALGVDGREGAGLAPSSAVQFLLRDIVLAREQGVLDFQVDATHQMTAAPRITFGFQLLQYHSPLEDVEGTEPVATVIGQEDVAPWWDRLKVATAGLGSAEPLDVIEGSFALHPAPLRVILDGLFTHVGEARSFRLEPLVGIRADADGALSHWAKVEEGRGTRRDMAFAVQNLSSLGSLTFLNEPSGAFNATFEASGEAAALRVGERFHENAPQPPTDPGAVKGTADKAQGAVPPEATAGARNATEALRNATGGAIPRNATEGIFPGNGTEEAPTPVPPATYRDVAVEVVPARVLTEVRFQDPNDLEILGTGGFLSAAAALEAVRGGLFERSLDVQAAGVPSRLHLTAAAAAGSLALSHAASGGTATMALALEDVPSGEQRLDLALTGVPDSWTLAIAPGFAELDAPHDPLGVVEGSYARGDGTPGSGVAGHHAILAEDADGASGSFAATDLRGFRLDQTEAMRLVLEARGDAGVPFRASYAGGLATGDATVADLPASARLVLEPGFVGFDASAGVRDLDFEGSIEGSEGAWAAGVVADGVPAEFQLMATPGAESTPDTLAYRSEAGPMDHLVAHAERLDGEFGAVVEAHALTTSLDLAFDRPGDAFQVDANGFVDRLVGQMSRHGGGAGALEGDHVVFNARGIEAAVGFDLTDFQDLAVDLAEGGTYALLAAGDQAFQVSAAVGDRNASLSVSNLPGTMALDLRPSGLVLDYDAGAPVDALSATYDRPGPGHVISVGLAGLPQSLSVGGVASALPATVAYEASGPLASLAALFRDDAEAVAFDATALALPDELSLTVGEDFLAVDARTAGGAAASSVVGSLAARHARNATLLGGPADVDHGMLVQDAEHSQAAFAGAGVRAASLATANEEVHADFLVTEQRAFAIDFRTDTSDLHGLVDALPPHLAIDYAGSLAEFTASAPVGAVGFTLDKGEGRVLVVEEEGLPSHALLDLGLATFGSEPRVTHDAEGGVGGLVVSYQNGTGGALLDLAASGVPPRTTLAIGPDRVAFNAASGPTATGDAAVGALAAFYASDGVLPPALATEDHASLGQGSGATRAALQFTNLEFASIDTALDQVHVDIEAAERRAFLIGFDTPTSELSARIDALPSEFHLDYAESLADVVATEPMDLLRLELDKGLGEVLILEERGLPSEAHLDLGLATFPTDPTVGHRAPGGVGGLEVFYQRPSGGAVLDLGATGVPDALDLAVAADLVELSTGDGAGGLGTLGALDARYASDGSAFLLPGITDLAFLAQGAATHAALRGESLRAVRVGTALDEVHLDLETTGGRDFEVDVRTPTSDLEATLEDLPSTLHLDYASLVVEYAASATVPRASFDFDPRSGTGEFLRVDARGVPATTALALGLGQLGTDPDVVVTYAAPTGPDMARLILSYRGTDGSSAIDADVVDVPRSLRFQVEDEAARFDAARAVGSVALQYGSHGSYLAGLPAADRFVLRDVAGETRADLAYVGLGRLEHGTASDELSLVLAAAGPRAVEVDVVTPSAVTVASMAQAPSSLALHAAVGRLNITPDLAIEDLVIAFDTLGALEGDVAIAGLPGHALLTWTPGGEVTFAAVGALDRITGFLEVDEGAAGALPGDFLAVVKGTGQELRFDVGSLRSLGFDPVGHTTLQLGLGAGGAPFAAVADLDGDVDAWATFSEVPATVDLAFEPASSFDLAASAGTATLTSGFTRASTGLAADLAMADAPRAVTLDYGTDASPTLTYTGLEVAGGLDLILRPSSTFAGFDVAATELPTRLSFEVAPDSLSVDARPDPASIGVVGALRLDYSTDASFLAPSAADDFAALLQQGGLTRAALEHTDLTSLRVATVGDELHADIRSASPRVLDVDLDTGEARLVASIDALPARLTIDLDRVASGFALDYSSTAPVGLVDFALALDASQFLDARIEGLPTSAGLDVDAGVPGLGWVASGRAGQAEVRSLLTAGARDWELDLRLADVPAAWSLQAPQGHLTLDVPAAHAPLGAATLTLTNHGVVAADPEDLVDVVYSAGDLDLAIDAGGVRRAEVERTAEGLELDLQMARGGPFAVLADVTVGTSRAHAGLAFDPLPASLQLRQVLDNLNLTSAANFDVLASIDVGRADGIAAAPEPDVRRGFAVRDGEGCGGCADGVRLNLFLEGAPVALDFDAGDRTLDLKDYRPPQPYSPPGCTTACSLVETRELVVDADLSKVTAQRVDWLAVARGVPNEVTLDLQAYSDTLAGSDRVLAFDYAADAALGSFAADLRMGSRAGRLELSALPTSVAVDVDVGDSGWTSSLATSSPLARAAARFRGQPEDAGFAAGIELLQAPASLALAFGRGSAASGASTFQAPVLTYTASASTLDATAFVDPPLFAGSPESARSSLGVRDLAAGAALSLAGNLLRLLSPGAPTASFESHLWAQETIDQSFDSCSPSPACTDATRVAYEGHARLSPATVRDLKLKAVNVSDARLRLGYVTSAEGQYDTLEWAWRNVSANVDVRVDVDAQADFGSLGCICGQEVVDVALANSAWTGDMLFFTAGNHTTSGGDLVHHDSDIQCGSDIVPTYDLTVDTKPHLHYWGSHGFTGTQPPGPDGSAWVITLDPDDLLPTKAVKALAAALSPVGGSFVVDDPCQ